MARNRLRPGEAIAGVCAVLLFVDMFLPWYEIGGRLPGSLRQTVTALAASAGVDLTPNAWQSFGFVDIVLLITILAALGLLALALTQRSAALPVAASLVVTALGTFATLLVLYRLINEPGLSIGATDRDIDIRAWAYVGLALCGGIALGGFLAMADEGQSLADAEGQPVVETRPAPPAEGPAGGERPAAQ